MKALCTYENDVCTLCGLPKAERFNRTCRAPLRQVGQLSRGPGLGDRIESALKGIGITQELVASAMEAIHLPPTCGGCEGRKEALNKFGYTAEQWMNELENRLGEAAAAAVSKIWRPLRRKPNLDTTPKID